ncbi:MAG: imidazole glycerol phosphate synthase subunit HisF [Deltaproteobacteria bacterium]|nr:imidazole glycerol phosphate synthase subunit HisF [Deltaproteobacteria bacterium]
MLKERLVAVLILRDACVVQSEQFRHTNLIHRDPSVAIEFFDRWAADEIVVLDVSRDKANRQKFLASVEALAKRCFVPLTVGGWITSLDDIHDLLRRGADKVILNTQAVDTPGIIEACAKAYGSQCTVISIDCRKNEDGLQTVYVDRGRRNTNRDPREWALEAQRLGAGEIFLTSIDHEGMREGYDLKLVEKVSLALDIPVIAFGGASKWEHLVEGINQGRAHAVALANALHYTEDSLRLAKQHMRSQGIDVR